MKSIVSQLVVAATATSMAFAPIAAQANTRAGDSTVVYSAQGLLQSGYSLPDEDDEGGLFGKRKLLAMIFFAAAIGGMVIVVDDSNNQSPGSN